MSRRVAVISPYAFHPPFRGNRAYILQMISCLQSLGCTVSFICPAGSDGDIDREAMQQEINGSLYLLSGAYMPARTVSKRQLRARLSPSPQGPNNPYFPKERHGLLDLLRRFWIDLVHSESCDEWFPPEYIEEIRRIQGLEQFETVFVIYAFYSKAFTVFPPQVKKVLQAQDVFTNRHRIYFRRGQEPTWYSTSRRGEAKALSRADIVLATQEHDATYYRSISGTPIEILWPFASAKPLVKGDQNLDIDILFVGSGNDHNREGIQFYLSQIRPVLRNIMPGLKLHLVGEICHAVAQEQDVLRHFIVDNLDSYYARAKVVINPVLVGTGMKVKSLEAIAYGCPLVSTSHGMVGMEDWAEKVALVADQPGDFAASIVRLIQDSRLKNEVRQHQAHFRNLARENFESAIKRCL